MRCNIGLCTPDKMKTCTQHHEMDRVVNMTCGDNVHVHVGGAGGCHAVAVAGVVCVSAVASADLYCRCMWLMVVNAVTSI